MGNTAIEWADKVWNPTFGCTKVSEGCKHCYAEIISKRFFEWDFQDVRPVPHRLQEPYKWKSPQKIFVGSLSDIFHKKIKYDYIMEILQVIARNQHHTFMILTKRAERMDDILGIIPDEMLSSLKNNLWVGVSVENIKRVHERIIKLNHWHHCGFITFISCEPLLENIRPDLEMIDTGFVDWIILGGESGRNSRPLMINHAREIREYCKLHEIPFFFKQWGNWVYYDDQIQWMREYKRNLKKNSKYVFVDPYGDTYIRASKKMTGHRLDGHIYQEFPKRSDEKAI